MKEMKFQIFNFQEPPQPANADLQDGPALPDKSSLAKEFDQGGSGGITLKKARRLIRLSHLEVLRRLTGLSEVLSRYISIPIASIIGLFYYHNVLEKQHREQKKALQLHQLYLEIKDRLGNKLDLLWQGKSEEEKDNIILEENKILKTLYAKKDFTVELDKDGFLSIKPKQKSAAKRIFKPSYIFFSFAASIFFIITAYRIVIRFIFHTFTGDAAFIAYLIIPVAIGIKYLMRFPIDHIKEKHPRLFPWMDKYYALFFGFSKTHAYLSENTQTSFLDKIKNFPLLCLRLLKELVIDVLKGLWGFIGTMVFIPYAILSSIFYVPFVNRRKPEVYKQLDEDEDNTENEEADMDEGSKKDLLDIFVQWKIGLDHEEEKQEPQDIPQASVDMGNGAHENHKKASKENHNIIARTAIYLFEFLSTRIIKVGIASAFVFSTLHLEIFGGIVIPDSTLLNSPTFISTIALFSLVVVIGLVKSYFYYLEIAKENEKIKEMQEKIQEGLLNEQGRENLHHEELQIPNKEASAGMQASNMQLVEPEEAQTVEKPQKTKKSISNYKILIFFLTGMGLFMTLGFSKNINFTPYIPFTNENFAALLGNIISVQGAAAILIGMLLVSAMIYTLVLCYKERCDLDAKSKKEFLEEQLQSKALKAPVVVPEKLLDEKIENRADNPNQAEAQAVQDQNQIALINQPNEKSQLESIKEPFQTLYGHQNMRAADKVQKSTLETLYDPHFLKHSFKPKENSWGRHPTRQQRSLSCDTTGSFETRR